uniref:Uncharacterized protein n=2 Tax=Cyprinus carpio TaxID=7962 RepID=A0A8C1DXD3_CYPCA
IKETALLLRIWVPSAVRLGRCSRWTGGGSSCPPGQDVSDCLSQHLGSRELLGKALEHVAEDAGLGHWGFEQLNLVGVPHVCQTREAAIVTIT